MKFILKHFRNSETLILVPAFLMALFLPLHMGISNLFLILFLVASGYLLFIKKEYVLRSPRLLIFTLLPLFLLYLIGVFYSSPPFIGTKVIGRTIAFLLCPLILLFYSKTMLQQIRINLFKGIVFGSFLSLAILLINNFLNYFATRPFLKFDNEILDYYYTYHYFTEILDVYPTYLGAYVLFSLVVLIHGLFKNQQFNKILSWAGIMFFSVGILFINSRIIFLLFGVVVVFSLFLGAILSFRRKKYLSLSLILFCTIVIGVLGGRSLSKTFIFSRFTNELQWELTDQVNTTYNTKEIAADSRIARWEAALEAIGYHPVFGYGTYTEKNVLADFYLKNDLTVSYKNRYDAHNMYLSFAVEYGIIGLILFLFFLFSNLLFAVRYRDVEFFFLLFMIAVISCFESYLQNNAAITFVALFGTVFLFSNMPTSEKDRDEEH